MTAKIDPKVLRKVRDMIRAKFTNPEIAAACGVSRSTVDKQSELIARFEGRVDRSNNAYKASRVAMTKTYIARGFEYDPEAMDLVDIFNTPRTPSQLRRFAERD